MESKVINDVVHGHVEFHPLLISIMDTPQFQRLRNIKQLGPTSFVYPGAIHTRFEHSIGTAFLAGKLTDSLNVKRRKIDEEARKESLVAQIAGLCHDLGHGPFSHTWEKFRKRCSTGDDILEHETFSKLIFERILDEPTTDVSGKTIKILDLFKENGLEGYIQTIKNMIQGKYQGEREKKYLYQIISNDDNGIDVDKWDYLMRDSKMTNVPINFDCDRILKFCKVLETRDGLHEICYREKECVILSHMFLSRGILHDRVYQHRKVVIIEEMFIDAFIKAKDRLSLLTSDVDQYLKLTDHVFQNVLYGDWENDEDMTAAKEILMRVYRRNLYICIGCCAIKTGPKGKVKSIESEIFNVLKAEDENLRRDEIKILKRDIGMTKKNKLKNLENVWTYDKGIGDNVEAKPFDWSKFNSLKIDLTKVRTKELLLVYKGKNRLNYSSFSRNQLLYDVIKRANLTADY